MRSLRTPPLRRLHYGIDLRAADLSLAAAGGDFQRNQCLVARQCRGRTRQRPAGIWAWQSAAHSPASRREHRPDRLPRRRRSRECDLSRSRASRCRRTFTLDDGLGSEAAGARRLCWRRLPRPIVPGCAGSAPIPTPSPAAGCKCAATAAGAASIKASRYPIMPTGPACCGRSKRRARSAIFVTHGGVATLVRYLGEKGFDAQAMAAEYGDEALEDVALPEDPGDPQVPDEEQIRHEGVRCALPSSRRRDLDEA